MAQRKNTAKTVTLVQLIEANKLTVSPKIARRKLRAAAPKHHTRRDRWVFNAAQAKAALKVLAA